ncbi:MULTISPECIES: hypothetical protein [Lysobacter]|uniref:hypothetical protein n=1 Tax=Lysobacter TaxID=68 RepID=UPI0004CFFD32|nr:MULTISPECIES: hypothetical protein [Lysobacter]
MTRRAHSTTQLSSVAYSAPFVIAERLMRFAAAGADPSVLDQREWQRMLEEKWTAALQGSWAMSGALWEAYYDAWSNLMSGAWTPWSMPSPADWWVRGAQSGERILSAGLAPVARTVSANHRRLARRKR